MKALVNSIVMARVWFSALLIFGLLASTGLQAQEGLDNLRQTSKAFASVAKKVSPAVVYIQAEKVTSQPAMTNSPFNDDFFRRFFGDQFPGTPRGQPMPEQRAMGQGSGFVFAQENGLLSDTTYILTNNHVVEGAEKITVRFEDGKEYEAKITGADPKSDVAVIEIDAEDLPSLELADSEKLEVGEWVVALGNPFGLSHTLTVGVVSATGRSSLGISDYEDFIQTDAAINPGNSGGPLVNLDGEVVGINTAIYSRSGGYMGVGFAIPSNLALSIAEQLIESGEVTRGYLGILIQPLTQDLAESFDIEDRSGILVAEVTKDSPADKAGLKTGDVIVEFEGKTVKDVGSFRNQVSLTPPGDDAKLVVVREGKRKTLNVEIGRLDDVQGVASTTEATTEIGITVQNITADLAQQFDAKAGEGVLVASVKPNSIAARAGIRQGDVILEVNRNSIANTKEFQAQLKGSESDKRALMLIKTASGGQRYVVLNW